MATLYSEGVTAPSEVARRGPPAALEVPDPCAAEVAVSIEPVFVMPSCHHEHLFGVKG